MTQRHSLIPSDLKGSGSQDGSGGLYQKFRKTRIEEDGNLYQVLIYKKKLLEGVPDKGNDSLLFTKNGEKLEGNSNREMLRIVKKKGTKEARVSTI